MIKPKVAFSKEFMSAYAKLPKPAQRKTRAFMEKFQNDPTQSGINFETLSGAIDKKVRSVRIDQAYRAIVLQPPKGDVYVCVWVDHHDDAYDWVRNRRFGVNPTSGAFQLYLLEEGGGPPQTETPLPDVEKPAPDLFDGVDDEDLLIGGVPEALLPAIRAVKTEAELDRLAPHLPADAAEILYMLAAGYSLWDAMEEVSREATPDNVDEDDFETALLRSVSQQSFRIVEDEDELQRMLDAPLEQWRVFLHPSQRALVQINSNGPVRVLGGAGTGKTVVLMHRALYLATTRFAGENDRILVTTFTRNLATDLAQNLRTLCSPEAFRRLEVRNLHQWTVSFLKRNGQEFTVLSNNEKRTDLFGEARQDAPDDRFPVEFYRDEWDEVVQAQEIDSEDAYLTARRVGRGVRLSKRDRIDVWKVLRRYRELLEAQGRVEWADVFREARLFIEKRNIQLPYRAVLVDEVQDLSASALRLLRTLAPDAPDCMYLVGDGHQRIYGTPVVMGHCGIEIRGRSRRLKLNYRTTQQIRNQAVSVLADETIDDLDGGKDSLDGYHSLREGPEPQIENFGRESEEASFVVNQIGAWLEQGLPSASICIAARTHNLLEKRYIPLLEENGIEFVTLQEGDPKEVTTPGIRVSTMHRMKGLEFSRVLLVAVQRGTVPFELAQGHSDESMAAAYLLRERCLFYVACTRARDELVICGFGGASEFLAG